ncbi:MAG: acetyl-CoA carboxylase biotin carboxyl carrier protein [Candidatus Caenarcaniphilales bacterium]|nr:acetyl-CoA carboxylase biotin carboxyl carrier protein [Candidatus Caenarcaniphilales bacterium]
MGLSYEQILDLMQKLAESPLSEISISQKDFSLTLKKQNENPLVYMSDLRPPLAPSIVPQISSEASTAQAFAPPASPKANLIEITSPMVGTFYAAPSPDAPAFVSIGDSVKPGDTLCIIEAMKIMNELPSEVNGMIEEICVQNAQTVEFGQVLFRVKSG